MTDPNIDALIISAGYSSRMENFKPLMLFKGFPFIISVICKTSQICRKLYVVTGYRSEDVQDEVWRWLNKQQSQQALKLVKLSQAEWKMLQFKVTFIHNEEYQRGMFGSLKIGLERIGKTDWILYHFVDQPHIPAIFYEEFSAQLSPEFQWIQPQFQNKNGHPIFIHSSLREAIVTADINNNLNNLFKEKQIRKRYWKCNYPEVLKDFDTESDMNEGGKRHESNAKND